MVAAASAAARAAALALAAIHRPHPYHLTHVVADDVAVTPRGLYPIFWGAFDWHSAVHGHWTLVAFARRWPAHPLAADAEAALARSFSTDGWAGELAYLQAHPSFERPYGLAWLCQLHAELGAWPRAATWATDAAPLAALAGARIATWLERLPHAVRSGTHAQSAFAAALAIDWARSTRQPALAARLADAARRLHDGDRGPALHLEPSGEDFLSPGLGAAALMARVLPPVELATWLDRALPDLAAIRWSPPSSPDRDDGRLVHLDGLAASRAWMALELAAALPIDDPRAPLLVEMAADHRAAALDAITAPSYAGGHWLGSFTLRALLAADL